MNATLWELNVSLFYLSTAFTHALAHSLSPARTRSRARSSLFSHNSWEISHSAKLPSEVVFDSYGIEVVASRDFKVTAFLQTMNFFWGKMCESLKRERKLVERLFLSVVVMQARPTALHASAR